MHKKIPAQWQGLLDPKQKTAIHGLTIAYLIIYHRVLAKVAILMLHHTQFNQISH